MSTPLSGSTRRCWTSSRASSSEYGGSRCGVGKGGVAPKRRADGFFCYCGRLLLWPGKSLASGLTKVAELLTAVAASPNPVAISLSFPG